MGYNKDDFHASRVGTGLGPRELTSLPLFGGDQWRLKGCFRLVRGGELRSSGYSGTKKIKKGAAMEE